MKLILIFSAVLVIAVCAYRMFLGDEVSQVQLTDYATKLQETAELKNEKKNTVKHIAKTDTAINEIESLSATLRKKITLADTTRVLTRSSEHASANAIDFTANKISPEDETLQENRGIDAMHVQVSDAPAPEADYVASESISGLPIPSEELLQSESKTDMY